jgi:hypothetical protein
MDPITNRTSLALPHDMDEPPPLPPMPAAAGEMPAPLPPAPAGTMPPPVVLPSADQPPPLKYRQ